MSDMLLANLTTSSKGEILETGGMIYIEAFANGEECKLKKETTIEIGFPYQEEKKDMQLFEGTWDSDKVDWTLDESISISTKELPEEFVFTMVEEMPEFPGGQQALMNYLSSIPYPALARENDIGGTVYVRFIIDKTGTVSDVSIVRGADPILNNATLEHIRKMPAWKAGKQRGQVVNVQMVVPIKFNLNDTSVPFNQTVATNTDDENFAAEFEKTTTDENINKANITRYLFSTSKLGWINCDRFYKINKPKVDYLVNIEDAQMSDIKIVFHSVKSILNGFVTEKGRAFLNMPVGEKVTLIALKYKEDKPYLAIKETTISKQGESGLIFIPVTIASLKKEMEKLNEI